MVLLSCLPALHAQEYGKIRALQQRAVQVTKLKNDFVTRVLTSYAIPHEQNAQGAVTRIEMEGRWLNITAVDIVPLVQEGADRRHRLTGHELLFHSPEGILALVSDLTVR